MTLLITNAIDTTAQTITVERDPAWWGDPAILDRIIYRVIDGDAQVDALANDEIDFIDIASDVNKLQRAESTDGIEIRRAGGPNFRHITFNGTSPVLSDVNVRQAIAKAIDRQTIADAMIGKLGGDTKKLDNHIFMRNQKGYQDNSGDLSKPDIEGAKKQLDDAGWTQQGDARCPYRHGNYLAPPEYGGRQVICASRTRKRVEKRAPRRA